MLLPRELRTAIEVYGKYSCRALASAIAQSLPVELRKMVFDFLTAASQHTRVVCRGDGSSYREYWNSVHSSDWEINLMTNAWSYFQFLFTGSPRIEILEAYFRVNDFRINDSCKLAT